MRTINRVCVRAVRRWWAWGTTEASPFATSGRGVVAAVALACGLAQVGCGPSLHVAVEPGREQSATQEDTTAARALIGQLRNRPWADEAALELQRAEGWLRELEQRLAADESGERTSVLMLALRTQLSEIKSYFAKREAEEAFDRVRGVAEEQRR